MTTLRKHVKLSPSDFAFLWEECPRCYYLKIMRGFKRPGGPFPSIFGVIDRAMRAHLMGQPTSAMSPDLPPGHLLFGEKTVTSAPIALPGRRITLTLSGRLDAIARFDDGSYGIIDFKTSQIKPASIRLYARQLRTYAYALENPAPDKLHLTPVSQMGLLAFTPRDFHCEADADAVLSGDMQWYPIQRNDESFMAFLDGVVAVLEQPEPPPPGPRCKYCQYLADGAAQGHLHHA